MAGSSVIGALRVNLGLDAAQFTKGLKQAQSSMSGVAARLGKVAASITAAAVPAMTALGVSAINSAAEIKRFSQVANATPEEFQRWAAGAKTVGIEQEKMADILKDVNDRVGDFVATGGGPMADFFERIAPKVGVTAEHFRNLSGPQALQLYVDTLQKANLNQQDFTFFMEAMASDSTLLIPLLRDGGKAMKEIGDRAKAMGAVMSGDMLEALNSAKTSITDMQTAATGMRNSLAVIALPAITAVSAAVTSMATALHENADTIQTVLGTLAGTAAVVAVVFVTKYAVAIGVIAVRAMAAAVGQSIALELALGAQSRAAAVAGVATKALSGALALLRGAIIATGIGALIVGAGYLLAKFVELVRATGGLGSAFSLLGEVAIGVWNGIIAAAGAIIPGLGYVWAKVQSSFYSMIEGLSLKWLEFVTFIALSNPEIAGGYDAFRGIVQSASKGVVDAKAAVIDAEEKAAAASTAASEAVASGYATAGAALAKLNVSVEETTESIGSGGSGLGGGLDQLADKSGGAKEKLSKLQEVMKRLREEAEKMAATSGMSDLQASIWETQREAGVSADSAAGKQIAAYQSYIEKMKQLKDASEEWRQSVKGAFSDFITQGGSFKDVIGQIIGKLGEMMFSKGFDALWGAGGSGPLGGIFGSIPKLLGFSNGTNFAPGGLARINERGGEIVNLPRGSQVIPHDISKRMADRAGASESRIIVEAVPNPYFDVRVSQIAQHGDRMTAAAGRQAMPAQINDMQRRGTR